jgi:Flp pilus assembly protein TadG
MTDRRARPRLPSKGAECIDSARALMPKGDMVKLSRFHSSARRRRSRGQAMVEFALVFPLFVVLLAGMIDFGVGLYSYMTLINAARDGARLGATACSAGPCSAAVTARVTAASSGMNPSVAVVCVPAPGNPAVNCASGTALGGDSVRVTASYTYNMIWPLAFGTQIPMTSEVTFMVE